MRFGVGSGSGSGVAQQTQLVSGGAITGNTEGSVSMTGNLPHELQSPGTGTDAGANAVIPASVNSHPVNSNVQASGSSGSVGGQFGLSDNEQYGSDLPDGGNSSEDSPLRFRNLNEIYEDTSEVDLAMDSDMEAMLAIMKEPACYREVVGDAD